MRSFPVRISPLLALIVLAGCQLPDMLRFPPQARGNKVEDADLKQLTIGTSTRQDATALLGSPSSKAAFDDNTWIYVAQITRPVIGGRPDVEDQRVVVLTFDAKGVLTDMKTKSQADALPVAVVARTTPSPGTDASWMQQLLGNIGRFSTSGASNQGQQGTSTNPGNF